MEGVREKIAVMLQTWNKTKQNSFDKADEIIAVIPKTMSVDEIEKIIYEHMNITGYIFTSVQSRKQLAHALAGHIPADLPEIEPLDLLKFQEGNYTDKVWYLLQKLNEFVSAYAKVKERLERI